MTKCGATSLSCSGFTAWWRMKPTRWCRSWPVCPRCGKHGEIRHEEHRLWPGAGATVPDPDSATHCLPLECRHLPLGATLLPSGGPAAGGSGSGYGDATGWPAPHAAVGAHPAYAMGSPFRRPAPGWGHGCGRCPGQQYPPGKTLGDHARQPGGQLRHSGSGVSAGLEGDVDLGVTGSRGNAMVAGCDSGAGTFWQLVAVASGATGAAKGAGLELAPTPDAA